jgi:hypothetical protein
MDSLVKTDLLKRERNPKMNIKKLTSTLLVTVISASNLSYAEPCINCVATILKVDAKESNVKVNTFKLVHEKKKDNSSNIASGMISLDDNEEPNILKVILDNETNNNLSEDKIKILYACDDTYKLVCDNIKKVCECV